MDVVEKDMGYTKAERERLVKERDQAVKLYTDLVTNYNFLVEKIASIGLDIQIFARNIKTGANKDG
jgi:hypothetical protein